MTIINIKMLLTKETLQQNSKKQDWFEEYITVQENRIIWNSVNTQLKNKIICRSYLCIFYSIYQYKSKSSVVPFFIFYSKMVVCFNIKGSGNADGVRIDVFELFLSDLKIEMISVFYFSFKQYSVCMIYK